MRLFLEHFHGFDLECRRLGAVGGWDEAAAHANVLHRTLHGTRSSHFEGLRSPLRFSGAAAARGERLVSYHQL